MNEEVVVSYVGNLVAVVLENLTLRMEVAIPLHFQIMYLQSSTQEGKRLKITSSSCIQTTSIARHFVKYIISMSAYLFKDFGKVLLSNKME
jgi:hypothetical protein